MGRRRKSKKRQSCAHFFFFFFFSLKKKKVQSVQSLGSSRYSQRKREREKRNISVDSNYKRRPRSRRCIRWEDQVVLLPVNLCEREEVGVQAEEPGE